MTTTAPTRGTVSVREDMASSYQALSGQDLAPVHAALAAEADPTRVVFLIFRNSEQRYGKSLAASVAACKGAGRHTAGPKLS
jgi:hypothetical protein